MFDRTIFSRQPGSIATLLAFGATSLFGWLPGLLDIAETDLLHGHPFLTVGTLALGLILFAPHRSSGPLAKILHGLCLGVCLWWTIHFLLFADLAARSDRTLTVLAIFFLTAVLAALGGASLIISTVFKFWLRRDRSAVAPLQTLELILFGSLNSATGNDLPAWVVSTLKGYHWIRRAFGRETTRSHAIEKAIEASLDEASLALRRALDAGTSSENLPRCHDVAAAAAAELAMFELLRRFRPDIAPPPLWPCRLVMAWDLIRWSEWITAQPNSVARERLLGRLAASPVLSPWLRTAAQALQSRRITPQSIRQLEQHIRPGATGEDLFGCILVLEGLNETQLTTWSGDFIERLRSLNPPAWIATTLARIQMQVEAQMLRHELALGPEETAVRRAHYSSLVLQADRPGLDATTRATLVRPLQAQPTTPGNRSTGPLPPLHRRGLDLGTGATPIAVVAASGLALATALWVYYQPIGPAFKPLIKLSGSVLPAAGTIVASDATPDGEYLYMATRGEGLHRLTTKTFRLRALRPNQGGPSSPWLSDLAVSKTGQTGVVTFVPSSESSATQSSGADIEIAAGWVPIIRPTGIRVPDAEKITHVLRFGANKLMREGSRWLIYKAMTRELSEITFTGLPEDDEADVVAADGQSVGPARAFVVMRPRRQNGQATPDRVFELEIGTAGQGKASDITGTFPPAEHAVQLLANDGRTWIRTESKRLYERRNGGWRLRLDADTAFATERISHAVLSAGPIATLWLVEAATDGRPIRIRARPLPQDDFLPHAAWRTMNLTSSPTETESSPSAETLKLNAGEAPPVAIYDSVRRHSMLLVAGRSGGLWIFSCNSDAPNSPATATLDVELVATPGERLLTVDASATGIVSVFESTDGTARRVALNRSGIPRALGREPSTTVLESILPDPAVLSGAKILLAVNPAQSRQLHLILDSGRILTWDRLSHGFTSRTGVPAVDQTSAELGALVSADFHEGKILLNDGRGRLLLLNEAELTSNQPRFTVLHQARDIAPSANLAPLRVATTNNGVEVFFGAPGSMFGEPWNLGPTSAVPADRAGPALISWSKANLAEPLNISQLTRIQSKASFENLVTLGESGRLFWRNDLGWMPWPTEAGVYHTLINAKGGTFASAAQSIRQIELVGDKPALRSTLWEATTVELALPVTAMAGYATKQKQLIIGDARGLATYAPDTRSWQRLPISPSPNHATWTLLADDDESGSSKVVWAVEKSADGAVARVSKVQDDSVNSIDLGAGSSVALAGDWLAVWEPENGLKTEGSSGPHNVLIPPKTTALGSAQLRRITGSKVLFALDERGRLLSADPAVLGWQLPALVANTQAFRDIETDADGRLLLVDAERRVLRQELQGMRMLPATAAGLQRVGPWMAAFDLPHGDLSLINDAGTATPVAGGRNPAAIIGSEVRASLTHGGTLFLSGPKGAVVRTPNTAQLKPIPESAGMTRFDHVGGELVAYRGSQINRLAERAGDYLLEPIPAEFDSVLSGPDGKLWGTSGRLGLVPLYPTSPLRSQSVGQLFTGEGQLSPQLRQAAPWNQNSVLLAGSNGQLLHYQPALRSFSEVRGFERLPNNWDLLPSSGTVIVKLPGDDGRSSLQMITDSGGPKLVPLEAEVLDVVQHGTTVAWIRKSDWAVRKIEDQNIRSVLTFTSTKSSSGTKAPITQTLLAPDDTLWALSGRTALQYSLSSQSIVRTVASIASLAKDDGAIVAVADGPEGTFVVNLGSPTIPNNTRVTGTGIGETALLSWRDSRSGREVILGRNIENQTPRLPEGLAPLTGAFVCIPQTTLLAWLSAQGRLVTYDYAYGRWNNVPSITEGWTNFGLAGTTLILHRKGTKPVIGVRTADNQIEIRENVTGPTWFTRDGWMKLTEPNPGARQIVTTTPDGDERMVREFARATTPFLGRQSGVFEASALGATLLLLETSVRAEPEARIARHTGQVISVKGLPPVSRTKAPRVFADATGFIITTEGGLFHVEATNGTVERIGANVVGVGLIGNQLHYLERSNTPSGDGFTLRRWADRAVALELGIIEYNQMPRAVVGARFVAHEGYNVVELETLPADNNAGGATPAPSLALLVTDQAQGLKIIEATGTAANAEGRGLLEYRAGSSEGLLVFGKRLAEDGWFDAQYPVAFADGTQETDQLPLRMRDGTVLQLPMSKTISPTPYRERGPVILNGAILQEIATGAKLGSITSAEPLLGCDTWRDTRPTSANSFLTLDALGQIWHWKKDRQGFRRELVPVPANILTTGLRLPLTGDSSIILVNERNQSVGKFIDGKFAEAQGLGSVSTPAERPGRFKNLAWAKTSPSGEIRMTLTVIGGNGPEDLPIRFSPAGLGIDRPIGLAVIPGDAKLWLHLGSAPDGRWLVCPAEPDGVARITESRLIARPVPQTKTAFSIGALQFNPRAGGWGVYLAGQKIEVSASGLLAIDEIKRAATLVGGTSTTLLLATAQPKVLVEQSWSIDGLIGRPTLVPVPGIIEDLRSWKGEFLIRVSGERWLAWRNKQWVATTPNWASATAAPSSWQHDFRSGKITWAGGEVPYSIVNEAVAFEADVLTSEANSDGAPALANIANDEFVYQSTSGNWFSWKLGSVVGSKTVAPARIPRATLSVGMLSLPTRSPALGAYLIRGPNNQLTSLPLTVNEGRLPHHDVLGVESWGPAGFCARLRDNRGLLVFEGDARTGTRLPTFIARNDDPTPAARRYDVHTFLRLSPAVSLHWQKSPNSFGIVLRKNGSQGEAPLGSITSDGIEIDLPTNIRPVSISDNEVSFIFKGELWTRGIGSQLTDFRRSPDQVAAQTYGPNFDPSSGRLTLAAVPEDSTQLATPWSGRFSPDGSYAKADSFAAFLDRAGARTALVVQRQGTQPVEMRIYRNNREWVMPFAKPRGAFFTERGVALATNEGDEIGYFSQDGQLSRTDRLTKQLMHLWRSNAGIMGATPNREITRLRWSADYAMTQADATEESAGIETTVDTFSLRRSPESGDLRPVWKAAGDLTWREVGDWQTNGLPGAWPHDAAHLGGNAILLADQHGIRRLNIDARTFQPAISRGFAPPAVAFSRNFESIEMSASGLRTQITSADASETGLNLQIAPPSREINFGKWILIRAADSGRTTFHFQTENGRVNLNSHQGGFDFDSVTALFDFGQGPWAASPAGLSALTEVKFYPANNEGSRTLLGLRDLGLTVEPEGPAIFSRSEAKSRLSLVPELPLRLTTKQASACFWIGPDSDWSVSRSPNGKLTISRQLETERGRQTDILVGQEIFAGNQLAFDHVRAIQRDPQKQTDLLLVTDRAIERLPGASSATASSRTVTLGNQISRLPPWRTVPFAEAGQLELRYKNQQLRLPRNEMSEKSQIFDFGSRLWVVDETKVKWIEGDDRWQAKRERDLRPNE